MASIKLDRAQRRAAGSICLSLFGVCNTVSFTLSQLPKVMPPSGAGCGKGLTESEAKYIEALSMKFAEQAEILRKLGHRFHGSKP